MQKKINAVTYATEHIAAALKAAREAKGLSQRELSQRSGVPQPHISKIESNNVDLRLSSLLALAHALDLELTLIPRQAAPAVQSIARTARPHGPDPRASIELARARQALIRAQNALKHVPDVQPLLTRFDQLAHAPLSAIDAELLRRIRKTIERRDAEPATNLAVKRALQMATALRNRLAHLPAEFTSTPVPAYRLDEDDHG